MRITLSGDLGSGKSSVGRRLAERLDVPYFSAGLLFREIGQISNLDALNTNLAAENNVDIDRQVDDRTKEIDRTVPSFIIDSRMAWHFVSDATKVYLSVAPQTAAERIADDDARAGESYDSPAAAVDKLAERRRSEQKRYQRLYGADIADIANYDLFIVTDDAAVEDIADLILARAKGNAPGKYWLPKSRLVPMMAMDAASATSDGAGPLPVAVVENYGFAFGSPRAIADALRTDGPFIAYEPTPSPQTDPATFAQRTLAPADLETWEKACAVRLSFRQRLTDAAAS